MDLNYEIKQPTTHTFSISRTSHKWGGGGGGDTHLGYGILGGKKSGIWDMRAKKSGIWGMGKSSGIWDIGVEIINF